MNDEAVATPDFGKKRWASIDGGATRKAVANVKKKKKMKRRVAQTDGELTEMRLAVLLGASV